MKITRIFPDDTFRIGEIPQEDRKYVNSIIDLDMIWIEDKKYYKVVNVFTQDKNEPPCECIYIIILKCLTEEEVKQLNQRKEKDAQG